ncbi:uveal autoantigen with coiled-coil domains and ankyrin repeats isoform X2 [Manduca sexta]|uniref:uveal autoantigen with coiled-coil domains and ankyrin repeats isoform X2 n=1 Tax=Manduca sexta TaxID=7130 RepID=UPI001181FDCC|nr:uveal autoantigen with coiled-coil domains and ankyrin repeats isoform X2 [Manduca sexta]
MAEASEVQALSKISSEVDESQVNVILTNQCIKAQKFLLEKLRRRSERHKEECGFISSANLKLECEIKQAELEIQSLRHALETIKHANIELKKDYLLAKEKKYEIAERINTGEKKYEQLWLESKSRYESIPFVKKFLQSQNKVQILYDNIAKYENQTKSLAKEIEIKKDDCKTLDKKRLVELAEFILHNIPKKTQIIQEKLEKINDLSKEIEAIEKQIKAKDCLEDIRTDMVQNNEEISKESNDALNDDDWANLNEINDDTLMTPKFDEASTDLDIISDQLEKIKKADIFNCTQIEEVSASSHNEKGVGQAKKYDWKVLNMEPYISPYFIKKIEKDVENETSYINKKLINILDDVNIGKRDVYNILSKIDPQNLQEVNMINSNLECIETLKQTTEAEVVTTCTDNIVVPPSQFLDSSQGGTDQITEAPETPTNIHHLKEAKRVSFNLSSPMELSENPELLEEIAVNNSPLHNNNIDTSAVGDDDCAKIKDMVLKKHNLESSPQFVYAKNTIPINISQKETVSGLLFTHGENALPESLDASISTTGYDDGEADFPHFIDSNLLLSPKADVQMGDDNSQVKSQEVPNFLSGLRKTGLSLFGGLSSSTPDRDNNNTNQNTGNSFKFSFGGDEKKNRGGFFNMFN